MGVPIKLYKNRQWAAFLFPDSDLDHQDDTLTGSSTSSMTEMGGEARKGQGSESHLTNKQTFKRERAERWLLDTAISLSS